MTPIVFVKDMLAFPAAWVAGSDYKEVKDKARDFVYSTARMVFAGSIIWGIFKAQRCEALRKLTMPVVLLTGHAGRIIVSLEPISLVVNLYLIKTASSKWITAGYCAVVGIWQCAMQSLRQWTKEPPSVFFSATVQRANINIDPLGHLMRIALWKLPETRLGIGLFATIFGIYQLHSYTAARWDLLDAPTSRALKGVFHVACGLCWWAAYENYNRKLESGAKKDTYLYKAADWVAPTLAWFVTGQTQ